MKALLNKRQILILSTLTVITATLALCMWGAGVFSAAVPAGGQETAVWETARPPRPSLNEHILWENRLGGTGNERALAAWCIDDKIILFGNTDSSDYDFTGRDGYHGFIAVLSDTGRTERFVETDEICAVVLAEQGFLLGLGGPSARLRLIGFDLSLISETPLYAAENEKILDIKTSDNGYTVITSAPSTTGADGVRVTVFDRIFQKKTARLLSRSAKLQYIDAFIYPDRTVVAVNYLSGVVDCLSLVELSGGNPLYYDIPEGGKACDVMPYADGFAALILSDGNADILTVNEKFAPAKRIYLNSAACTDGSFILHADRIYAYLHKDGDMSQLCELDENLTYLDSVAEANVYSGMYAHFSQGDYLNVLCSSADMTVILSLGPNTLVTELRVQSTDALWVRTKKGLVLITESQFGEDCPGQIGGTDICVIAVA